LVFSYSSGYFTAAKYSEGFDKKVFWLNKFKRLGLVLLFADLFLLILFLIQKRPDILSWYTIVSGLGLTGLLNWFYIPNKTPFGAGLWFLTLLYIFYIFYPFLLKLSLNKKKAYIFCILYSFVMWLLNQYNPYGHALWLTSCGFIWGVVMSRHKIQCAKQLSLFLMLFSLCFMIFLNFIFVFKQTNFLLMLIFSINLMLYLEKVNVYTFFIKFLSPLKNTVFFIYILHPYLYLSIFDKNIPDTLISIVFVIFFCKLYEVFTNFITNYFKSITDKKQISESS
jgi:hypothetical protein